ncbi:MAG: hypothetical protein EXQ94_05495 [Alphaproteobacteria bacterium]|nr:hypothetical protein [Alphaproteobacteria bacterium]
MGIFGFDRRRFVQAGGGAAGAAVLLSRARALRAQDRKVVRIRAKTDIRSLDTVTNFSIADFDVRQAVLNNLILFKPGSQWTWRIDAAEEIKQVDPTHTAFRLRPGIQWTNGYGEMTAEDVQYSFMRLANPELKATDGAEFAAFQEVQITDSYSGVIVTKEPVANLWTNTLPRGMGCIVCKKAWEERGGWLKSLDNDIPCSSGPYKLKEWIPQQRVVLERNDLWSGPPVYFDEVQYILIEDDNTAEIAYLAGELDIAWVSTEAAVELQATPPADTDVIVRSTTGFIWLGINVDHTPYGDLKVREAVRKVLDVQQVIDGAYGGLSPKSTGVIAPGMLGELKMDLPPRDVEGARALLAEAGLADGFKTTITCLNNTADETASQIIQANLAEIGIQAEIKPYEGGTYWNLGLESAGEDWKNLELIYQDWTSGSDPRRSTQFFTCEEVGNWNWQRWCDEEYSKLDKEGGSETDLDKRATIYTRMMDVMWASAAFLSITHPVRVTAVRSNIEPNMLPNGYIYARDLTAKA